jgi:hypothetical protein
MRRLRGSLALGVIACALAPAIAGCGSKGSYRISWTFPDGMDAASGCGFHGVDGIRITGASSGGDGEDITAVCSAGSMVHSVPPGSWAFAIHSLDVIGQLIHPLVQADDRTDKDGAPMIPIDEGKLTDIQPPLVVQPRPQCSDGVDNDRDGLVDLADPDCQGDSSGASELPSGTP